MASSGQSDWWVEMSMWCKSDECEWEGDVEVCIDRESLTETFECPDCGFESVFDHDPVYE